MQVIRVIAFASAIAGKPCMLDRPVVDHLLDLHGEENSNQALPNIPPDTLPFRKHISPEAFMDVAVRQVNGLRALGTDITCRCFDDAPASFDATITFTSLGDGEVALKEKLQYDRFGEVKTIVNVACPEVNFRAIVDHGERMKACIRQGVVQDIQFNDPHIRFFALVEPGDGSELIVHPATRWSALQPVCQKGECLTYPRHPRKANIRISVGSTRRGAPSIKYKFGRLVHGSYSGGGFTCDMAPYCSRFRH